ncbi:MAG: ABC transporter ATP-binding protein, partial [Lactobacillus crispatus]|nr:ABC transporter ATP-binding protein [Lactobacillus crispatus]
GIKDIREIIFTLKSKLHMTILISSHVLAELDLVADEYVIMNKGKVLKEISKVDILHLLQDKILLECSIPELAKKILSQNGVTYTKVDSTLEINKSPMSVTQIIDLLRKEQIEITGIYRKKTSLEDYYFSLIERNL